MQHDDPDTNPPIVASIVPHKLTPTARAQALIKKFEGVDAQELITQLTKDVFQGQLALVSSFGADAAVLLHMVSEADRDTPVIFLETGMLFKETLDYQQDIARQLGLTNVQLIRPETQVVNSVDPEGVLHQAEPDKCCHIRKTLPLERALTPYKIWITGRKRFQSAHRANLPLFEADEQDRLKVNPLINWKPEDVKTYMEAHNLPRHPLVAKGFPSIGCAPCTSRVRKGEDARAGRWRGQDKDECGIHFVNGKIVRGPAPSQQSKSQEAAYASHR